MHIYDKQCEIMQKNQWKSPNIQIQCFYNGTVLKMPKKTQKLEKLKRKLLKILKRYDLSGWYHVKADVLSFQKMW